MGCSLVRHPGRLEQVVDNLLNNALEVAPERQRGATRRDRPRQLGGDRVSDEGPGMTDEERARAFDRFWQSPAARRDGRPNGHFGLGLAIVRELVVADGGEVGSEPSTVRRARGDRARSRRGGASTTPHERAARRVSSPRPPG